MDDQLNVSLAKQKSKCEWFIELLSNAKYAAQNAIHIYNNSTEVSKEMNTGEKSVLNASKTMLKKNNKA